ncbi:proteasome subunit beta type-7-like [Paramacrobiotus metropolitanus]|uniref:proteasome subunit beta type-7-like n=1 Tax=Paramacrobiotus metropolitanus TaxID=2943436 RepID=UPI002445E05D|nr:proteasome subunit beta type-7-like [Paramacrobiotus metropolitanus]
MASAKTLSVEPERRGFNFELHARNQQLVKEGVKPPKMMKTGTTTAAVVFKDGVVLGADTRATGGNMVMNKNCAKIHFLARNMYCLGAGTAADTEYVTRLMAGKLEMLSMSTRRVAPVKAAVRMLKQMLFRYQGHIQAALIVGGVDTLGPHIISIAPHGSSDNAPYLAMGSGSIAAMSVLETYFRPDMTRDEAVKLIRDAINAGVTNDLFSGSNIDICVITKDKSEVVRPYEQNQPDILKKENSYVFQRGKTTVLSQTVKKIDYQVVSQETRKITEEPMETS